MAAAAEVGGTAEGNGMAGSATGGGGGNSATTRGGSAGAWTGDGRLAHQIGQALRHLANRLLAGPRVRHAVPAGIGADRQHGAQQHHRPGRHAALGHRGGEGQVRLAGQFGRLGAETAGHVVGIEAEQLGIGAQEPNRVGPGRQVGDAAFLDGAQNRQADAQMRGDRLQVPAEPLARAAQIVANTQGTRRRATACRALPG